VFSDGANIEIAEEVCSFSPLSKSFTNNFLRLEKVMSVSDNMR
jgi:hypothetical protein